MKLRIVLATAALAFTTVLSAAPAPPRLVVLLVVDQMRADYVERFKDDWSAGLKRLVTDGAWFTRAAYPYLSTLTCAGHATIGSGAFPHVHGIFQNLWYDRGRRALTTCTQDANVNAISYGKPATGGESAYALGIPNFADELRLQRGSRVVSLALKARSAIMMGGHGGVVTWVTESLDSWETSTAYTPEAVPEVRDYVAAHPMDADFGQTWNRLLPPAKYPESDAGLQEAPPLGWTPLFPHVLKGNAGTTTPDNAFYDQWQRSPYADAYVARMAAALAEAFGLGKTDRPDLLAVSFSSPDLVGHVFGPNSQEIRDMYAQLDRTIGGLLDTLDRTVGRDNYVVALTADHGVTVIPEQLTATGRDGGRINAGALVNTIEQTAQVAAGPGKYIARITGNDIYFEPGMFAKLAAAPAALEAVSAAVSVQPGINRVIRGDRLSYASASASDRLVRAAALSYFPGRGGDLILVPKDGWMFAASGTTHGSASADDQRVPILLFGKGVKAGQYEDEASPADVAPTLAALAGISLPLAEGRPLRAAIPELAVPAATPNSAR